MEQGLNGNPIFHYLTDEEKRILLAHSRQMIFKPGEYICQEEDKPQYFF